MSKKLHELVEKTATEGNEYVLIDDSNGEGDSKKLPVSAITKPLSDKYDNVADALQELVLEGEDIKEDVCDNTLDIERLKYYGDVTVIPTDESKFSFVDEALEEGGAPIYMLLRYIGGSADKIVVPYSHNNGEVVSLGLEAFWNCSAKSIILPNNFTTFYGSEFTNCTNLKSFVIPPNWSRLSATFQGCTNLEFVAIPDATTSFDYEPFSGCNNLTIICNKGSAAETYAKENGIPYKYSDCDYSKLSKARVNVNESNWPTGMEDENYAIQYSKETNYAIKLLHRCEACIDEVPTCIQEVWYTAANSGTPVDYSKTETPGFTIEFPENINDHYESYLIFSGTDVAPTIQWPSGIIYKGDDCSEDGVFIPCANTNYEIAFKYTGVDNESGIPIIVARVGSW